MEIKVWNKKRIFLDWKQAFIDIKRKNLSIFNCCSILLGVNSWLFTMGSFAKKSMVISFLHNSGASQIVVRSLGLNYFWHFTNATIWDGLHNS